MVVNTQPSIASLATDMRFRSFVVSWYVCAIHGGVQTLTAASGHRSLDETSSRTFTRDPFGDVKILLPNVLLERSPRSIPGSLFPVSSSRSRTDDRENIANSFVLKRGSTRHKRRKKCSHRKQDARRRIRPRRVKLADDEIIEESKSSMKSSRIVKSPSTTVDVTTNISTSTLNPTLELTTESSTIQPFVDITDTTTDAVPSTTIAAKVIDETTRGKNYQQSLLRKKCKKRTKCATEDCKHGKKKKAIDILGNELFSI